MGGVSSNAVVSDNNLKQNIQKFEKVVESAMARLKIPGCAFVVVRKGAVIHEACFGYAMLGEKKVTKQTMFPLSSLTKNVTAVVTGCLVDDGLISFDDPVRKYISDFFIGNEYISSKFTIKDLISHRSGFKHFLADSLWRSRYDKKQMINSLRYINDVKGFRKKYGYQNIIFGIVEEVMEAASGQTYDDLVDKYVISKMQLEHTSTKPLFVVNSWFEQFKYNIKNFGLWHAVCNLFSIKTRDVVTNYTVFDNQVVAYPLTDYFQRVKATAGVSMSIQDLGSWLRMLLGQGTVNHNVVISQKSFDVLTANQVDITNLKEDNIMFPKNRLSDLHYGMGFFNGLYSDEGKNARRVFFHMGGVYGVSNFFAISPDDDLAVGILCNLGGTDRTIFPELMIWQFFDMCFGYPEVDWAKTEIDSQLKMEKDKVRIHNEIVDKNPGPHAKLEKYVGVFNSDIYGNITISLKNGNLWLDNGISQTKLMHLNQHIFEIDPRDLCENYMDRKEYVVFYPDANNKFDNVLVTCWDENKTVFKRKN